MLKEKLAAIAVILVIAGVPCLVFSYQYAYLPARYNPEDRVFNITAVGAGSGAYTLENVNGLNYWWKRFSPMTIYLIEGDTAILRLSSADVFHQFYVPLMDIGPVDIKAGKIVEVRFTADKRGKFQYFCTTICGKCHCYMTGWIVVSPKGETPMEPDITLCPVCFVSFDRPADADMIDLGEYVYLDNTCNACHGMQGIGGVRNPNYARETIPAHDNTAEKIFLKTEEDAELFNELIMKHKSQEALKNLDEEPDIPMFNVVMARYEALKQIILEGSRPEKLEPEGPEPPLWMPSWEYKLTDHEIDALITFFVYLYQWDDEESDGLFLKPRELRNG